MSAIPQRGPHVRDLFVKPGPSMGVGYFEADNKESESRANYDLSGKKKRPAPPPPVGLGQYKPRILSGNSESNIRIENTKAGSAEAGVTTRNGHGGGPDSKPPPSSSSNSSKPFIIGDKDTPLVLHSDSVEPDSPGFRVSSSNEDGVFIGTSNPLFDQLSPKFNGDVSLPNGHAHHDENRPEQRGDEEREPDGVFIPAPDYDEDEKTMVFSEEPDDDEFSSEQQGKKVYKEYVGEDFAQYLSDEENGMEDGWSRRQKRFSHAPDRTSKTEVKRTHYKKRDTSTLPAKAKKDNTNNKSFQGSNSLRSFSYADSKYGTLNGSNKRLSVHSLPDNTEEGELFVSTGSSYEQFLCSKNGEELPPFVSEVPQVPARYARPSHKKDTLWKKLTWRFKKHSKNGFDVEPS